MLVISIFVLSLPSKNRDTFYNQTNTAYKMKLHDELSHNHNTFINKNYGGNTEIKVLKQDKTLINKEEITQKSPAYQEKDITSPLLNSNNMARVQQQSAAILQSAESHAIKYSKIALTQANKVLNNTAEQLNRGAKHTAKAIRHISLAITRPINRFMHNRFYPVVDNFLSGDLS